MSTTNVNTSTVDPETDPDIDPDLDMDLNETDMDFDTPESYTLDSNSSKPVDLFEPDQESLCRPRSDKTTTDKIREHIVSSFTGSYKTDSFSWITGLITLACISGFILLVLLYYFVKRPELVFPFTGAFVRIFWYLFIYSVIVFVMISFIRLILIVIYFIKVTIEYFNLMMNPLLNPKVSELTCYFTDYVNMLIYYPAMIFYLICFIGLLLFDSLILLPALAIFGLIIGTLFSLLGKNRTTEGKKPTSTPSGLMGKAASLMGAAKGMVPFAALAGTGSGADLGQLAASSGVPDLGQLAASSGVPGVGQLAASSGVPGVGQLAKIAANTGLLKQS